VHAVMPGHDASDWGDASATTEPKTTLGTGGSFDDCPSFYAVVSRDRSLYVWGSSDCYLTGNGCQKADSEVAVPTKVCSDL
jgi:hypothetical protein